MYATTWPDRMTPPGRAIPTRLVRLIPTHSSPFQRYSIKKRRWNGSIGVHSCRRAVTAVAPTPLNGEPRRLVNE